MKHSGRAWARGLGVSLHRLEGAVEPGGELARALRDGVERGYEGPLPPPPAGVECYVVRAAADGEARPAAGLVGLLAFQRDQPEAGAVTVVSVATLSSRRGHAFGARALLLAERRLCREGVRRFFATVPRGNGRGLYFMLRAGYAPVAAPADGGGPDVEAGVTWFRRSYPPSRAR